MAPAPSTEGDSSRIRFFENGKRTSELDDDAAENTSPKAYCFGWVLVTLKQRIFQGMGRGVRDFTVSMGGGIGGDESDLCCNTGRQGAGFEIGPWTQFRGRSKAPAIAATGEI